MSRLRVASPDIFDADTHERLLTGLLARCRRRAWLQIFSVASTCALGAGAIVALGLHLVAASGTQPVRVTGLVAAFAVACGAVMAAWRCPTTAQIASVVDRRALLDDSLVAALQIGRTDSALAPLVMRHAASCSMQVRPADVVPLRLRAPLIVGASGALALVGLAVVQPSFGPAAERRGGAIIADAGRAGAAVTRAGGDANRDPAVERDTASGRVVAGEQVQKGETAPQRRTNGPSAAEPMEPDGNRRATAAAARSVSNPDTAPPEPAAQDVAAAGEPDVALAPRTASSARPFAVADTGGTGSSGSSTGHVGNGTGDAPFAAAAARPPRGAGGVRGGQPVPFSAGGADASRPRGNNARGSRGQPGDGSARQRDEVPPELRRYVRDYLAAVRASTERE